MRRRLIAALVLAAAGASGAEFTSSGTLGFRFRCSRTVRKTSDPTHPAVRLRLVHCPVLDVTLEETKRHPQLWIDVHEAEPRKRYGNVLLSHLEGGRWYHLAVAWDAPTGRLEVFLNGVRQQYAIRGFRKPQPWKPPPRLSGDLVFGATPAAGDPTLRIETDSAKVWTRFLDEAEVRAELGGLKLLALDGEGRTVHAAPLDLAPYTLTPVYQADFSRPLSVVAEDALFDGERRTRLPEGKDWVLEGPGRAWTEKGRLHIESSRPTQGGHVVLWNTRTLPADFLLEFAVSPRDSSNGLNIVFFCATSREGGDIFGLSLPRRGGIFKNYHTGALNSYHISYWAGGLRRTANLRKNYGFFLPACGDDRIANQGPGPHTVRLLKAGGSIRLETRGRIALAFDDGGKTYGPVHGPGRIGLRQMGHTHRASYSAFKVWRVEPKPR